MKNKSQQNQSRPGVVVRLMDRVTFVVIYHLSTWGSLGLVLSLSVAAPISMCLV